MTTSDNTHQSEEFTPGQEWKRYLDAALDTLDVVEATPAVVQHLTSSTREVVQRGEHTQTVDHANLLPTDRVVAIRNGDGAIVARFPNPIAGRTYTSSANVDDRTFVVAVSTAYRTIRVGRGGTRQHAAHPGHSVPVCGTTSRASVYDVAADTALVTCSKCLAHLLGLATSEVIRELTADSTSVDETVARVNAVPTSYVPTEVDVEQPVDESVAALDVAVESLAAALEATRFVPVLMPAERYAEMTDNRLAECVRALAVAPRSLTRYESDALLFEVARRLEAANYQAERASALDTERYVAAIARRTTAVETAEVVATIQGAGCSYEVSESSVESSDVEWVECSNGHGQRFVTETHSYLGFAGGACEAVTLSCGCTIVDESSDVEAAR